MSKPRTEGPQERRARYVFITSIKSFLNVVFVYRPPGRRARRGGAPARRPRRGGAPARRPRRGGAPARRPRWGGGELAMLLNTVESY